MTDFELTPVKLWIIFVTLTLYLCHEGNSVSLWNVAGGKAQKSCGYDSVVDFFVSKEVWSMSCRYDFNNTQNYIQWLPFKKFPFKYQFT